MNNKIKNIIFDLGGVILDLDENATFNELAKIGIDVKQTIHSTELQQILSKFDIGVYTAATFRKKMKEFFLA